MNEVNLSDWRFFLRDLETVTKNQFHSRKFVFRGQRDCDWSLVTSFDRSFPESLINRNNEFNDTLAAFENRTRDKFGSNMRESDLISLAQHYGLPTRVLDWSFSPYVALFFSVSGAILEDAKKPAALWVLDKDRVQGAIDQSELCFIEYFENKDHRIRNQRGMFTKLLLDEVDLSVFLEQRGVGDALSKITITPNCFLGLARHIKSMDLTFERLFPGLDGICQEIIYERLIK